jgi:hypothetical protein
MQVSLDVYTLHFQHERAKDPSWSLSTRIKNIICDQSGRERVEVSSAQLEAFAFIGILCRFPKTARTWRVYGIVSLKALD